MEKIAIVSQTDEYWVINKPAGVAVEPPSKGQTLLDDLLEQGIVDRSIWQEGDRFGVVHRLDGDTSGLLIWAKTPDGQKKLRLLWQGRQVEKRYRALVYGQTDPKGEIDLYLSRDTKKDRQRADLFTDHRSRPALTRYTCLEVGEYRGERLSYLELTPVTGRTHQLRVHLKSIGHPILGDRLYGSKKDRRLSQVLGVKRQLLHSYRLRLSESEDYLAPIPPDFQELLDKVLPNFKD